MDRLCTRGASRPPSRQSQLSFSTRNTSSSQRDSQEDPAPDTSLLEYSPPTSPASFAVSSSSIKSKRKRTAWVYKHQAGTEHMKEEDGIQAVFLEKDKEVWPCRHCAKKGKKKLYLISAGTLNIERHLVREHSIVEQTPSEKRAADQQSSIEEAMKLADQNTQKRRRLTSEDPLEKELDPHVLESLFTRFLATNNQSLHLVQCPEFRTFLTYLNSNVNVWLPSSHSTIAEWIQNQYNIEKDRIRLRLHSTRTKIHLSLDIWTSPNSLPILGVIAHYISEDNQLESTTLALKEIQGSHDGENIAPIVEEVLEDWGIISKLGYLQMDNASTNDTLIRALSRSKLL